MSRAFLAALTMLVACQTPALAQPTVADAGFWGSADYLFWWIKDGQVPPLVTSGGTGVPGAPGTQVLVDDLDFVADFRQGGRFALGYNFDALGFEGRYFFLGDGRGDERFSSGGAPILGRPYIDLDTGAPAATLISTPGVAAGTVAIGASTRLSGAEANFTGVLVRSPSFHVTALGGCRFLRLGDELEIGELFRFAGNLVSIRDVFRTDNRFYGGQLGLASGVQYGLLTLDLRGKLALGQMQQSARINGLTSSLAPSGMLSSFQGGLLALRSNIGTHEQDELAFIPEVGVNLGLQLTSSLKLSAGYSFLWVSSVARAGGQIDPVINISQFPILSGNGPLVGAARPAFSFHDTDFWAQGLNLALELKY